MFLSVPFFLIYRAGTAGHGTVVVAVAVVISVTVTSRVCFWTPGKSNQAK